MKYYAYYRCSTMTQIEKNGIQMQRDVVEKYCRENGIEIEEEFVDAGISGTKIDREGLSDMLATLEAGDRVIVQNTSRLWRDNMVCGIVMHEIQKAKADVISVEQIGYSVYESDNETDVLLNGIMQVLDQYDRICVKKKLYKGRKARAKSGHKPCGIAPLGYKWHGNDIVIDEENCHIIQEMFVKYSETGNLSAVKRYCDEHDYVSSRGNSFTVTAIKNILSNDFYIGKVKYADSKIDGQHEPIIDEELFNSINAA